MKNITNPKLASLLAKKKAENQGNRHPLDSKPQPKKPRVYNASDIENVLRIYSQDNRISLREGGFIIPIGKTAEVLRGTYRTTSALQFYVDWVSLSSDLTFILSPKVKGIKEGRYEAHGAFTEVVDSYSGTGDIHRLIVYNQLFIDVRDMGFPGFDSFSSLDARFCGSNPLVSQTYQIPSLETNYCLMKTYGFGDDETRSTMKSILDSTIHPTNDLEVMLVSAIVQYANKPNVLNAGHFVKVLSSIKENADNDGVIKTYKDDIEFALSKIKSRK